MSTEPGEEPEPGSTETKDVAMEAEKTEEDQLLYECDVYLNRMYDPPDFVGDMYLLQYPLRPSYRPYGDQGSLERVELKAKSRRLRFLYRLNQNDHYANEEDVTHGDNKYERRHTLTSTVVANPACSYAVGVIRAGRMTLTPVRAVNQLRTDFEDFEKLRSKQSAAVAAAGPVDTVADGPKGDVSDSGGEEPMEMVDINPVRVEYHTKGETEVIAQPDVEDAWKRLDFFDQTSPEAHDIYLQHIVFAANEAHEAEKQGLTSPDHPKLQDLDLDGDHLSYVRGLCGQAELRSKLRQMRQKMHHEANAGLSSYVLSKMPPERQVEAILRQAGVLSFVNLRKRLPASSLRGSADSVIIEMLRACGVLVCGNWVLKSTLANFEGMEAGARDLLLTMLHRKAGKLLTNDVIKWKSVFQQSVAVDTLLEIARSVMDESQDKKYWMLKAEEDKDFIRRYPAVAAEYDAWLSSRRDDIVKAGKEGQGSAPQGSSAARFRGKLVPEVRECLLTGPKTTEEMRKLVQRKHPTAEIREEDLLGSLNAKELDAIQVRGVWVLAGTGTESHDKFRKTLLTLFKHRDSVTRQDVMEEYERVHGERCRLSDYIIRQQLREIAEKIEDGGQTIYVVKGAMQTR